MLQYKLDDAVALCHTCKCLCPRDKAHLLWSHASLGHTSITEDAYLCDEHMAAMKRGEIYKTEVAPSYKEDITPEIIKLKREDPLKEEANHLYDDICEMLNSENVIHENEWAEQLDAVLIFLSRYLGRDQYEKENGSRKETD